MFRIKTGKGSASTFSAVDMNKTVIKIETL